MPKKKKKVVNTLVIIGIIIAILLLLRGCQPAPSDGGTSIGVRFYDRDGNIIGEAGDIFALVTYGGQEYTGVAWIEFFVELENTGNLALTSVGIDDGSVTPIPPPTGQDFGALMATYTKKADLLPGETALYKSNNDMGCEGNPGGMPDVNCALDADSYATAYPGTDYTFRVDVSGTDSDLNIITAFGTVFITISEDAMGDISVRFFPGFPAGGSMVTQYMAVESNWVNSFTPDDVMDYNAETIQFSYDVPPGTGILEFGWLKFNIPLQDGKIIESAILNYKIRNLILPITAEAYRADDSWSESTITFNNQPPAVVPIGSLPPPSEETWFEFDVTAYIQEEYLGDKVVSINLRTLETSPSLWEVYTEDASSGNRPYIKVTYH